MPRPKYPLRYMTKQREKQLGINLSIYPNSGPYPNVTGLRRKVYGYNAPLVRQGAYVYSVPVGIWASAT